MATYQGAPYVLEQIRSIQNQTYTNWMLFSNRWYSAAPGRRCRRTARKNVAGATRVNTLFFILKRLAGREYVRETFRMAVAQAGAFEKHYQDRLDGEQSLLLNTLSLLLHCRKGVKLFLLFEYSFWKQGLVQRIGEILFI